MALITGVGPLNGTEEDDVILVTLTEQPQFNTGMGGNDLMIGIREPGTIPAILDVFFGGAGNDTLIGSGTLEDGFIEDYNMQHLWGDDGDDVIYVGVGDMASDSSGTNTFILSSTMIGAETQATIYGGSDIDRVVVDLVPGAILTPHTTNGWLSAYGVATVENVEEIQIGINGPVFAFNQAHQVATGNIAITSYGSGPVGATQVTAAMLYNAVTAEYTYYWASVLNANTSVDMVSDVDSSNDLGGGYLETSLGNLHLMVDGLLHEWQFTYNVSMDDTLSTLINDGMVIDLETRIEDSIVEVSGDVAYLFGLNMFTKFDVDLGIHIGDSVYLNTLAGLTQGAMVRGSDSSNTIVGTDFGDQMDGGAKHDLLIGGKGSDTLMGGDHGDTLYGDDGVDILYGDSGNDWLYGGADIDMIFGGTGRDFLSGGDGNDFLVGGRGTDTLEGNDGDDDLSGGIGDDILFGGLGNDTLRAGTDNDIVFGGDGDDRLFGHDGDDSLYGGDGRDRLIGGAGNDLLDAGGGSATLVGGSGMDTFVFRTSEEPIEQRGTVRIRDFVFGEDILDIHQFNNHSINPTTTSLLDAMTQVNDDTILKLDGGAKIVFEGLSITDFQTHANWHVGFDLI